MEVSSNRADTRQSDALAATSAESEPHAPVPDTPVRFDLEPVTQTAAPATVSQLRPTPVIQTSAPAPVPPVHSVPASKTSAPPPTVPPVDPQEKVRRLSNISDRERQTRLAQLDKREREASLEHEVRLAHERRRKLHEAAAEKRRLAQALNPRDTFRTLPNPRRGRRHSSTESDNKPRVTKIPYPRKKRKRRKRRLRKNKIVPAPEPAVEEPGSNHAINKPKKVKVPRAPPLPVVQEDSEDSDDSDSSKSSTKSSTKSKSSSSSEPDHPLRPKTVKPKRRNLQFHYHHKDGRKDDVWDPTESDVISMYNCESMVAARLEDLETYEREKRKIVQQLHAHELRVGLEKQQLEVEEMKARRIKYLKAREQDRLNHHKFKIQLKEHEQTKGLTTDRYQGFTPVAPIVANPMRTDVAEGIHRLSYIKNVFLQHQIYRHPGCIHKTTNVYQFVSMSGRDLFRIVEERKSGGCFGLMCNVVYSWYTGTGDEVGLIERVSKTVLKVRCPPDNPIGSVEQIKKCPLVNPEFAVRGDSGVYHAMITREPIIVKSCEKQTKVFTIDTSLGGLRGRIRDDWDELPYTYVGAHFPAEVSVAVKALILAATILLYDRCYKQRSVEINEDPRRYKDEDDIPEILESGPEPDHVPALVLEPEPEELEIESPEHDRNVHFSVSTKVEAVPSGAPLEKDPDEDQDNSEDEDRDNSIKLSHSNELITV